MRIRRGSITHDFNNQLSITLGYAELLTSRLKDSDLKRFSEPIVIAAKRSGELTKKLLSFSRLGHFERVPVDLHDLIDEIVALLGHNLDKRIAFARRFLAGMPSSSATRQESRTRFWTWR